MQEDIIYKLKTLQSIEPEEAWLTDRKRKLMEKVSVFGVKNDIFLSGRELTASKSKWGLGSILPNRMAVSLTSLFVLLTSGILTVAASQSSLPGEALYPIKKAGEQVALAVASDQDKPKIEIEQAGKRLEELAQVSQKTSDTDQHQKVEQLVTDFKDKVESANNHLSQLNQQSKSGASVNVASVAKVVNEQSEKYTEVLQKTTDNLPETVKEKVADKVAVATVTTEKTNLTALMVMVENKQEDNATEVAAKVQKTVEKAQGKVDAIAAQTAAAPIACATAEAQPESAAVKDKSAENVVKTEEAKTKLQEAKDSLKNDNLTDTLKSVSEVTDIAAQVAPEAVVTSTSVDATAPAAAPETAPAS